MMKNFRKPFVLGYQSRREATKPGVDGRLVVGVMIAIFAMMLAALMFSHVIW